MLNVECFVLNVEWPGATGLIPHSTVNIQHSTFRFIRPLFLLLALLPTLAAAEENCGAMVRTSTRFRGTIRSVELLGKRKLEVTPVDRVEPKWVVTVDIDSAEDNGSPLRAGQRRHFAVHSPSRTFGSGRLTGRTLDLQTEWMTCDGKFRRFDALWRPITKPETLAHDFAMLEIGHVYRAAVHTGAEGDLELDQPLWIPHHHDQGIVWTNLGAFPDRGTIREVVFEATSVEITMLEEWHWLSMWNLTIRSVSRRPSS